MRLSILWTAASYVPAWRAFARWLAAHEATSRSPPILKRVAVVSRAAGSNSLVGQSGCVLGKYPKNPGTFFVVEGRVAGIYRHTRRVLVLARQAAAGARLHRLLPPVDPAQINTPPMTACPAQHAPNASEVDLSFQSPILPMCRPTAASRTSTSYAIRMRPGIPSVDGYASWTAASVPTAASNRARPTPPNKGGVGPGRLVYPAAFGKPVRLRDLINFDAVIHR